MRFRLSRDEKFSIVALLPAALLIAVFVYYPALSTFGASFSSRNLYLPGAEKFVFLQNYLQLLADVEFWQVVGRSLLIIQLVLPLELLLGFGVALLLNEQFYGRSVVRMLVILPWMLPPVVNGFLWGWLLNGDYGALNAFLYQIGVISEYQFWMHDPRVQLFWVVIAQIWSRFAFPTLIMLAGLQSIPPDLYEVAEIDGAGPLARLWHITLPLLLPAAVVALIVEFIAALQIFDLVWTLTGGGTVGTIINPSTKTLMLFNYQIIFRDLKIGLGSAMAYLILLMSLAVGLLFVRNLYAKAVQSETPL